MKVLGIDPGFSGAMAIIDTETMKIVEKFVMPVLEVDKKKSRKVRKKDPEFGKQKTKTYVGKHKMINLYKLNARFERLSKEVTVTYLEQVHSRPMEGVSGAFRFGQGYGNLEAFLVAHEMKFKYVTPAVWTNVMHQGIVNSIDAKGRSIMAANKLYPEENFIVEGCRKLHDGLIDSVLVARYGAEMENKNE